MHHLPLEEFVSMFPLMSGTALKQRDLFVKIREQLTTCNIDMPSNWPNDSYKKNHFPFTRSYVPVRKLLIHAPSLPAMTLVH